jgi:long-chain acyl-CoA synthetase
MWEKLSDGMFGDPGLDIARPSDHADMRARAGIDSIEIAMTGAATLPPHVAERLRAVGIELCDSYGMTEFGPAVGTPRANRPGTSGRPFPGTELRIADDGEIQLRGPAAFRGYRNNPEASAAAFTADGFVRTGDLGSLDDDGYLSITGRMKDIIIASGGHNVAPAPLENALVSHPLIASAVVVGEGRKYLVALIVLDPVNAPEWGRENGVAAATFAQLAASPSVRAEIDRHVAAVNENFAPVEQVKKTSILTVPWLPDSEELTPTMKVRRAVVQEKYRAEIDELYQ